MDLKDKTLEIQNLISQNRISQAKTKCQKLIKKFPDRCKGIFLLTGIYFLRKH